MKLKVVAYLIKEGYKETDIINRDKKAKRIDVDINGKRNSLYIKSARSKPKWSGIFTTHPNVDESIFFSESVCGMFIVEAHGRLIAFTFGHAKSLLLPVVIQRGFGLRVSLNLGDSEQIKSIDKATLNKVALKTRSQTSKNTNVSDFDFEFDHEILKSISAVVEADHDELEIVSGSDSVSLYTKVSLEELPQIATRIMSAYMSDKYLLNYPWIDFIQPVTDPDTIFNLNDNIIHRLNSQNYESIWIACPEIMDYDDFSGFVYTKRTKQGCSVCMHPELDLKSYVKETKFKLPTNVEILKRKQVYAYNSDEVEVKAWSLFRCFNVEVELDGDIFVLNDSQWYRLEKKFSDSVNEFFKRLPRSTIDFPPYGALTEGEYLRKIADGENFALLDQKWIYPQGTGTRIEFCDLLSQCDAFIHVKKYGASSVLSHLFSQATVATELLLNDNTVLSQVNSYLDDTYLSVVFDKNKSPRTHRVVLAIMHNKQGEVHLPFFSKVNLRHHSRRLQNMGFTVEITKINA
ncbi:TIGR04141 family sporadically distributed protein [Flocculibacter collagenilyticus]|uniref:TIGR04141 family sporadically distributed protein n=1 Tax=Flocculibacter collagenilyticus TaxID=2744479 RepID=UPI0018F62879|nr:TIGR04141 family sporadically distributed protein [Flocculibacter collagenilyticus]